MFFKNLSSVIQLVPILNCKYNRVLRKVEYRLQNNLKKNFGFEYGNTNDMRLSFDETGMIDFNIYCKKSPSSIFYKKNFFIKNR